MPTYKRRCAPTEFQQAFQSSRHRRLLLLIACLFTLIVAGCGSPSTATYVDPNPPGAFAGSERDPIEEYGRSAFEHQIAFAQVQAHIQAARGLVRIGRRDDAVAQLQTASDGPLIGLLGSLAGTHLDAIRQIRHTWGLLGASFPEEQTFQLLTPVPTSPSHSATETPITSAQLAVLERQVEVLASATEPSDAARDFGWQAAIASQLLDDVGTSYENAYLNGSSVDIGSQYAYGWAVAHLVLRRIHQLPRSQSAEITRELRAFIDAYYTNITPPARPSSTDKVVEVQQNLGASIQDVFGVVVAGSEPRRSAVNCLRNVADTLTQARSVIADASQPSDRSSDIRIAMRRYASCASDVASLDTSLTGRIESKLGVLQSVSVQSSNVQAMLEVLGSVINDVEQARSEVRSELDALSES